jgi:ABC-type branched-subunit amino acid transport system substrate-binding protein
MHVVLDHEFSSGEDKFRPLIQRMKQQKADAIVFASANQASLLSFLKQRRQLAPGIGVLANQDFEGYKTLPAFAGMEQGILYTVPAEADREFRDAFERRYSSPPILTASNAYDAVKIIATALEAGATTPHQIAEFLRAHEFHTASFRKIRFSPLGGIEGGDFVVRGKLPTLGHAS